MAIGRLALKLCALLHDIGKLKCWARQEEPTKHIFSTYEMLKPIIGEELAKTAMRHHKEPEYKNYMPVKDEEWIIAIANDIVSGERCGEGLSGLEKPYQIVLTFPLSSIKSPITLRELSPRNLARIHNKVKDILSKASSIRDAQRRFEHIYWELRRLEVNELSLHDVPADICPSMNDHSLWSHLKMTCAIATCIYLQYGREGELLGKEPDDYTFALIGGDADRIGAYLNRSLRLPDLRGGSDIVKEATQAAANCIASELGPDCVIFSAGGNFLAVAPAFMADDLIEKAKEEFERATDGELTITVCKVEDNGSRLKRAFGQMWRRLRGEVRKKKLVNPIELRPELRAGLELCDVCGRRPWRHVDPMRIRPYDMAPRPERLCEACNKRRLRGLEVRARLHLKAESLEDLEDEDGYVALIKADGDSVGRVFDGSRLMEYGREVSPARLDFLSTYIHEVCERELRRVVEKDFGGEVIYAGGDDLLAIVKGRDAFKCARAVHDTFVSTMREQMTMSLGVLIMKSRFPIYVGLLAVSQLLDNAKSLEGKNGIDFDIIYQIGITKEDVSYKARERLQKKKLTARPYKWDDFVELLDILEELKGEPMTQLRTIEDILMFRGDERIKAAETFIKSQIGRCIISYRVGKRLLKALSKGFLTDALMVMERVG